MVKESTVVSPLVLDGKALQLRTFACMCSIDVLLPLLCLSLAALYLETTRA